MEQSINAAVLATAIALLPVCTQAQTLVAQRTLSFNAAHEAASSALDQCRKDGYRVTVTVLDGAGRTAVVLHDDGAAPHTTEHSLRKAHTAYVARQSSAEYGKRVLANPAGASILQLENMTLVEGGLPIQAGRDLVGAIGISGAPGGDKDAACGQAGIDRIARGLAAS